ncbi:MAG: aminopeptidase [Oscillospiraceae bacterium]|nr:aminopeptidase [Oscillospiraceae bacterium]
MSKKTAKELKKELFYTNESSFVRMSEAETEAAYDFCEEYKSFLDDAKTEREAAAKAIELAKANGFSEFRPGTFYTEGDKIWFNNRNKSVILAVIGKRELSDGVRIAAAHIDSPRLDMKQNPLFEDGGMAFLKTRYYGGIKKYQWTTIPLSLHGAVVKKDGETVTVKIGEDEGDPVFVVTDLLPHLAQEQMDRKLRDGINAEKLNILVGSRPFDDSEESDNIKLNIMNILHEKYGIVEADFQSAELEAVPAFGARDVGLDRSMIGSYGHDDRVCAYPALMAILDTEAPEYTCITVLTDKEETGSDGNTGLHSSYLKYFIADLAAAAGIDPWTVLSASECLSADVNSAYDPNYADAYESRNSSFVNKGVCISKYTGSRGKSGTSDAGAEFVGKIRALLDNANVCWQTGELGRVDLGGGGTVAKFIAALNVDVVDIGVPVLSMHAPFEVVGKADVYAAYMAFSAFFNS